MSFDSLAKIVEFVSNSISIIASSIAIYIFFCKKEEVKTLFRVLVNYSYQTTLSEIKGKLERLNEYNASDPTQIGEIINICHEIAGQIKGNTKLQKSAPTLSEKIEKFANGKRLTEPSKRSLVSEVREVLKNLDVGNIETYID